MLSNNLHHQTISVRPWIVCCFTLPLLPTLFLYFSVLSPSFFIFFSLLFLILLPTLPPLLAIIFSSNFNLSFLFLFLTLPLDDQHNLKSHVYLYPHPYPQFHLHIRLISVSPFYRTLGKLTFYFTYLRLIAS